MASVVPVCSPISTPVGAVGITEETHRISKQFIEQFLEAQKNKPVEKWHCLNCKRFFWNRVNAERHFFVCPQQLVSAGGMTGKVRSLSIIPDPEWPIEPSPSPKKESCCCRAMILFCKIADYAFPLELFPGSPKVSKLEQISQTEWKCKVCFRKFKSDKQEKHFFCTTSQSKTIP